VALEFRLGGTLICATLNLTGPGWLVQNLRHHVVEWIGHNASGIGAAPTRQKSAMAGGPIGLRK